MQAEWPERISVFALPTMPPLHIALLRELSRWIDVRIYAMNPCQEFWYDIVSVARVEQLEMKGELDYQEVGNPLLAEWGRQTQAQLHMLHELTEIDPEFTERSSHRRRRSRLPARHLKLRVSD